jgi:hypothetical protein
MIWITFGFVFFLLKKERKAKSEDFFDALCVSNKL